MLNRAILCMLLKCTAIATAQSVQVPVQIPDRILVKGIPADYAKDLPERGLFPLPGDQIIPQIANGTLAGGHFSFTWYQVINITDAPAVFELMFFDSLGNPLAVPIFQSVGAVGELVNLSDMIPARGGGADIASPAYAPATSGYAASTSIPEGAIVVTGIFGNQVPGEHAYQASVPLTTFLHKRFYLAFTNTGRFVTSLAVVFFLLSQNVSFVARDASGDELCRARRFFQANEYFPFIVRDFLPCTFGTKGVLAVEGSAFAGLSGVGFIGADEGLGAFVTLPV